MAETMKAVRIHEFGGPEVLRYEDAPRPDPAGGELLVRVHAASVNPVDWKSRQSGGIFARAGSLPVIPGWDVSGVVEAVGPGVAGWAPGDEAFSLVRFPGIGAAYAEYATVPATEAARKPQSLTHIQAAAIPLVALTVWQVFCEAADLQPGQRVLVHAAAGGVGHVAVQIAKAKGAYVIGTASGRNEAFVRGLGADQFVDYTTTRFEDVVHDVDVVLDTMAGETRDRSWSVLRKGGILVSILGDPSEEDAARYGARGARVLVRSHGGQLAEIGRLVDEGRLRPTVGTVLPLHEAARAHELSAAGHARGKIVLEVVR